MNVSEKRVKQGVETREGLTPCSFMTFYAVMERRKEIKRARTTRKTGMESLGQKVEQAKQKVIKAKAAHEQAVDELQILRFIEE